MDHLKRVPVWLYWVGAFILFYLFSYGPLVYIRQLMPQASPAGQTMWSVVTVVYYPHVYFHSNTEFYYRYTAWWSTLALGPEKVMTWEEYNRWNIN